MPYYAVTEKGQDSYRIVQATTPTAAIRHVAGDRFTAKTMNPGDIVAALEAGRKVERIEEPAAAASATPKPEPAPKAAPASNQASGKE